MARRLSAALLAALVLAACDAGDPVGPAATDDETAVDTPSE